MRSSWLRAAYLAVASSVVTGSDGEAMRYLLYDVKLGEGFNLQKEIFMRAGQVGVGAGATRGFA